MNAIPNMKVHPKHWMACALLLGACLCSFAAPSRPDYSTFSIIPERNIFNTKRSPAFKPSTKPATRTARNEFVALTGTMHDEKGPLAFFDGSQSDYRKVLKLNETIAGFQVEGIEHAYVKLKHGTNETILPVNKQLAREEQGEWQVTDRTENRGSEVTQSSSGSNRSGSESDSGGRRDDRRDRNRDRRGGNDSGRSDRNPATTSGDTPGTPMVAAPAANDAGGATNTNASGANVSGPQTEADILRIMEERRRLEDQ